MFPSPIIRIVYLPRGTSSILATDIAALMWRGAPIGHRMTCLKDGFYLCTVHQPNVSNVISKETGGGKSEISRKVAQFGPNFYPRRINSPITCNIGTPPLTPLALLRCETLDTEARLHRKTSRWPRNHAQ